MDVDIDGPLVFFGAFDIIMAQVVGDFEIILRTWSLSCALNIRCIITGLVIACLQFSMFKFISKLWTVTLHTTRNTNYMSSMIYHTLLYVICTHYSRVNCVPGFVYGHYSVGGSIVHQTSSGISLAVFSQVLLVLHRTRNSSRATAKY